jgi:hypothetical protein
VQFGGLGDGLGGVVGQGRSDLDRNPPVVTGGGGIDVGEQVARVAVLTSTPVPSEPSCSA